MKTTASFAAAFATLIVLGAASAPAQYAPLPDLRTFSVVTDGVRPPSDGRIRVDASAPDRDADGIADRHDLDMDGDGIPNALDNCPCHPNASQADLDGDGIGDLCDDDLDGDGQPNALDRHPMDPRMATEVASGSARLEDVLQQALRARGPFDGNQLVRKGINTAARPWMPVPTPVAAPVKLDPAEPRTGDAPRRVASASSPSAPRATSSAPANSERPAPAHSASKSEEPAVSVRLEGRRATLELDSNPIGRAASDVGRWLSNAAGDVGETVQEAASFNLDNAL